MVIRWPTNSPADHRPSQGRVLHSFADTTSAARKSSRCARSRFSTMVFRDGTVSREKVEGCSDRSSARLLKGVRQLQHSRLAKRRPENLQPHWQLPVNLSARHGDPRDPCQGPRNRIYISKIHLERVVRPLPQFEG